MESPRKGLNLSPQAKKGVHIHVKLPSGTEVHEFILPVGYTVDQVKRAIFKQIPDLATNESNPNDYQFKLRDNLRSKEEILNVEFSKLQNLDTVRSADAEAPLELSILSTKVNNNARQRLGSDTHETESHAVSRFSATHSQRERAPSPRGGGADSRPSVRATSPRSISPRGLGARSNSNPALAALQPEQSKAFKEKKNNNADSNSSNSQSLPVVAESAPPSQQKQAVSSELPATSSSGGQSQDDLPAVRPVSPPSPSPSPSSSLSQSAEDSLPPSAEDVIKSLRQQLALANADRTRLASKMSRITRLVRSELLPLAGNGTPAQQPAPAESEIVASEKRLRSTLALVLAEIERPDSSGIGSGSSDSEETSNNTGGPSKPSALRLPLSCDLASAALLTSSTAVNMARPRTERAVSSAADFAFDDVSGNKRRPAQSSINSIAARMNLEVPDGSGASLASSSSSPSTLSGSSAVSAAPLPPRKTLTPQERTEMLQQEFLDTEETYLKSLQKLHDHFEAPLEASGLLTPEQCDTLFSRVRKQLLEMHRHLLQSIREKPAGSSFSDSLLVITPYLKLYTEYVNNHPEAINLLIELNANSKKFATLLKQLEQKPEVEQQDLSSYLIRPIQRLPRYEMLLRDLVKYTTEETEHLKLSRLLEAVKKVNEHLNEAKRKRDNSTKLANIQNNLILGKNKGFSLFSSQLRTFVREDTLLVKKVKKEKTTFAKHHFFLMNDILLDTVKTREGKFKLTQIYSLSDTSFQKYEGESDTVALFHTTSGPDAAGEDLAKAIHVKADQGGDIDGWLRDTLKAKSSVRTPTGHEADESRGETRRYQILL